MIVVDASALIAIGALEPDMRRYLQALQTADQAWLAPANYLETGVVLIGREHLDDQPRLDLWLASLGVTVAKDFGLGAEALDAYQRFGKGIHPARLNLADCFAYALARQLDAPLLYKGEDFALTDIRSAL